MCDRPTVLPTPVLVQAKDAIWKNLNLALVRLGVGSVSRATIMGLG